MEKRKGSYLHVIPPEMEGNVIPMLAVKGDYSPDDLDIWNNNVPNGVRVLADNVTIDYLIIENVHVGLDIVGENLRVNRWVVNNISGDVFQGNADQAILNNLTITNLLATLPYPLYHADIGQWRHKANGVVIDGVTVKPSDHKWARKNYQGIMFTDPLPGNTFSNCLIQNITMPEGNSIHAVTFAEAQNCVVNNIDAPGYVNFRNLTGKLSRNNTTNHTRINYFMNKMFDPVKAFELDNKNIGDIPVGILFNNPGAIVKYRANEWVGAVRNKDDLLDYQKSRRPDLERFYDPLKGLRAIGHILLNKRRRGLNTVRKIIEDYAPPSRAGGNNTNAATENYVQTVAKLVGVDPDIEISVFDWDVMYTMIRAIVSVENDKLDPYPDEYYTQALLEIGIPAPGETPIAKQVKPLSKSREATKSKVVTGIGVTGAGGTVAGIAKVAIDNADAVTEAVNAAPVPWLLYSLLAFNLLLMVAAAYLGWQIYKARKENNDLDIV